MNFYRAALVISCLLFWSFKLHDGSKIKVYLIGDSTLSIKEKRAFPETGWGMPFAHFFDSTVVVDNRAMNGRSTRTFIEEGRWDSISKSLGKGDYVFIQFGHNDEVKTKKSYTKEQDFKTNLCRFIQETREKKAFPILITPVARRKFDESGKIEDTHKVYAEIVRNVADETKVPLIDLSEKSMQLMQDWGEEKSKYLFNHLVKGQNPNYPEGKLDDTHFNELGARYMAELVLKELTRQNIQLVNHIVKPVIKLK